MPKLPHVKLRRFKPTKQQLKQMQTMLEEYQRKPVEIALEQLIEKIFMKNDQIDQYKTLWREALKEKQL